MAERCNGCIDRPLSGEQDCTGLLQTLSVNTGIENYVVQVCTNVSLVETPARFHETEHNGTGIVTVHQLEELTQDQAIAIAQNFDL